MGPANKYKTDQAGPKYCRSGLYWLSAQSGGHVDKQYSRLVRCMPKRSVTDKPTRKWLNHCGMQVQYPSILHWQRCFILYICLMNHANECCVLFIDIHSTIKLSLQSIVMAVIIMFTCSTVSRLVKPVTSRLYRSFTGPALPGICFTVPFLAVLGTNAMMSWHHFSRRPQTLMSVLSCICWTLVQLWI